MLEQEVNNFSKDNSNKVNKEKRELLKKNLLKMGVVGAGVIGLASAANAAPNIFWRSEDGSLSELGTKSDGSKWQSDSVGYIKPKDNNKVKVENIEGTIHKNGDSMTGHLTYTTPQVVNCVFVATEPSVGDMVEGTIYFVAEEV